MRPCQRSLRDASAIYTLMYATVIVRALHAVPLPDEMTNVGARYVPELPESILQVLSHRVGNKFRE